ncbi:MAG: hypothetical protein IPM71_11430 [Bacteroidota bacterium]|nr:MAG: hypothetical protein IPM71_11430 [Bacteroidota bacterium]
MGVFFQSVFEVIFVFGLLLLFVVSIIILKPFRVHRKRPITTIALKGSYLLFLASFLIFTYLLLFGPKQIDESLQPYDSLFNIHFLFYLSASVVPNVGIMLRRQIRKKRIEFNLMLLAVNIIYLAYMVFAIVSGTWALI